MITIKTPARLHLGLLDTNGDLGRMYGSIGVAIEKPNIVLEAEITDNDHLVVDGEDRERVENYARTFLQRFPLPFGIRLTVQSCIPAHVGLGSGTQLALATGTVLARLGELELSPQEIASLMGRGVHSGIGIAAFQKGGFILDGGHRVDSETQLPSQEKTVDRQVPQVIFQHPVPPKWCFVIAIPNASPGISGEKEVRAFSALPSAPASLAEKISRLVLIKMLPSLIDQDIEHFGEALTDVQRYVGDCFADVQGGRFANTVSDRMISFFLSQQAYGAGQSSWGPTVYALVDGQAAAAELERRAKKHLSELGGGTTFTVHADNRGAQVSKIGP